MNIFICIYPHAYVRISICIYIYICRYVSTCACACVHIYIYLYIYICIHIYIYIYIYMQTGLFRGFHITGSCLGISILGMVAFGRFQRKPSRLEIPVWGLGLRM